MSTKTIAPAHRTNIPASYLGEEAPEGHTLRLVDGVSLVTYGDFQVYWYKGVHFDRNDSVSHGYVGRYHSRKTVYAGSLRAAKEQIDARLAAQAATVYAGQS